MSNSNPVEEAAGERPEVPPEAMKIMRGIYKELIEASQDPENHPAFARMREHFRQKAEREKEKEKEKGKNT